MIRTGFLLPAEQYLTLWNLCTPKLFLTEPNSRKTKRNMLVSKERRIKIIKFATNLVAIFKHSAKMQDRDIFVNLAKKITKLFSNVLNRVFEEQSSTTRTIQNMISLA